MSVNMDAPLGGNAASASDTMTHEVLSGAEAIAVFRLAGNVCARRIALSEWIDLKTVS